ncbi:putative outer membrane efflux protein, type I secretion protein [Acinetobacter baumannii SDF]|uniref:Outer membrane efflux protein, type I secretion protein n=1 Tax=Acinetobacter baumannii (strain SDF) TaxID=509170 RepID=B0VUB9_ACIBS|nr:putative outer membrane efflux protein, type I secretion protein [Acinetobacter baumannii SDF]
MSKLPFSNNDLHLIIKSGTKFFIYFCIASSVSIVKAETSPTNSGKSLTKKVSQLFKPQPDESYRSVDFQKLSNLRFDQKQFQRLGNDKNYLPTSNAMWNKQISLIDAIQYAVQRNPSVSQAISTLAGQNAGIDYAKAGYYPQISGGITTGDLSSGERGRQLLTLSATQMLYDFGKVKSGVSVEKAKLQVEQANVLVSIDDIALDVAQTIVNIQRYLQLNKIAEQQIAGIRRIQEIANLRANAGVASQADPIQAQSYLQAAQSALIAQQSLLRQYQQHLRTLLGADVSHTGWIISDDLVNQSDLYGEPEFNTIPKMIAAQAGVEVAKAQKQQTRLTRYPTLAVKGSVSQAINGKNPNNDKDDGLYSSVMLEATSRFYQGGATASQVKMASYAEEAAKSKVNSVYLDVLDQIRTSREQIENKQRQMQVLANRQATTVRTRELYQEQYKLGTRSLVDLLNAEQAIHSANSELESARYDIYSSIVQYIEATGRSRQAYGLNNISIQGFEVQP